MPYQKRSDIHPFTRTKVPLTDRDAKDGHTEPFNIAKLSAHIRRFCFGLDEARVDTASIIEDTVAKMYNGIATKDLEALVSSSEADISRKSQSINRKVNPLTKHRCRHYKP